MNRQTGLLTLAGVVVVLVLYYLFVWSPMDNEVADLETQIDETVAQQEQVTSDIRRLEDVRARAPEIEAALAAAQSIVPYDSALPGALRQLQVAADESGATLVSVQPGRPSAVEDSGVPEIGERTLTTLTLSVQMSGGYYQLVDFLRRVETPAITPRGVVWSSMSVSPEEYPTLTMSLSGQMYALLEPAPGGDGEEGGDDEQPTADADGQSGEDGQSGGETTPEPTGTEEQQ